MTCFSSIASHGKKTSIKSDSQANRLLTLTESIKQTNLVLLLHLAVLTFQQLKAGSEKFEAFTSQLCMILIFLSLLALFIIIFQPILFFLNLDCKQSLFCSKIRAGGVAKPRARGFAARLSNITRPARILE